MDGKIAYIGKTEKGKGIEIRYPAKGDLNAMWEYIHTLSKEPTFIRYRGEEISLEEEEKFLNSTLEKINQKKAVFLTVWCDGKLIGASGIELKNNIERHLGVFGITIAKEFRGEGIGIILMKTVMDEAINNLTGLEIIELGVYAENDLAKQMYKKFGFLEYGMLPNGIKLEEGYADHIFMYKAVK